MSDGLNTHDRWYGNGSATSTSVDKRMYESATVGTCANIKAARITIYTIHVNTGGDPTSTLLQNCATDPDKFWMVTTAGDRHRIQRSARALEAARCEVVRRAGGAELFCGF